MYVKFEMSALNVGRSVPGVNVAEQLFNEHEPEFERVVSQAVFSKDFTQTPPSELKAIK